MFIGALDQGTTSTRFMVFDASGAEVARCQLEHRQIMASPGWVEHDPVEIAARVDEVIAGALGSAGLSGTDLAAVGVTNQRETTVVWNPKTGQPWCNAIVWQDTRTDEAARALDSERAQLVARTGLPPSTYFSSLKLEWILDHIDGVGEAARRGEAVFGAVDHIGKPTGSGNRAGVPISGTPRWPAGSARWIDRWDGSNSLGP